jgi:hypothetical protein
MVQHRVIWTVPAHKKENKMTNERQAENERPGGGKTPAAQPSRGDKDSPMTETPQESNRPHQPSDSPSTPPSNPSQGGGGSRNQ